MSALAWLALLAIAALAGQAAIRGRRELRAWLGRDPAPVARLARALALSLSALLAARALSLALTTPERLSDDFADVVIAVDTSTSMDVTDVAPSRLRRALRTAERAVEQAEGVRFALVVFAGEAFIALPLTQDRDAVLTYLRALDSETISVRGSELARGLQEAARAFDPRSSRPRTVLLLTDGESFGPATDGQIAALASLGARVVAVGYGTEDGGAVPGQLALAEAVRRGEATVSRRGDAVLRRVASETGGAYFREIEERPTTADLLPPPTPGAVPEPERTTDPLLPWLAAAGLALLAELWLSGESGLRVRRPRTRLRRLAAATLSCVALAGTAFGPLSGWLEQGDAALEAGRPDEALALYREAERARGSDARTQIRIGNALFRLERVEQAASAYLEALRALEADDTEARFAASFNLGNTLVAQKHFEEARDAYWAALLALPESLEAKFNYEWSVERILEIPPVPETEPNQDAQSDSEAPDPASTGEAPGRGEPQPAPGGLDEREAQAWLETLEEPVGEALERQVTNEFDGRPRARPGGKTW
ncbi:MAG: VWA domain-containing protein [Myxococcota bacterium]